MHFVCFFFSFFLQPLGHRRRPRGRVMWPVTFACNVPGRAFSRGHVFFFFLMLFLFSLCERVSAKPAVSGSSVTHREDSKEGHIDRGRVRHIFFFSNQFASQNPTLRAGTLVRLMWDLTLGSFDLLLMLGSLDLLLRWAYITPMSVFSKCLRPWTVHRFITRGLLRTFIVLWTSCARL